MILFAGIALLSSLSSAHPTPEPTAQLTNRESIIASRNYPEAMREAGVEGRVATTVDVAADGSPTRCTVVESSGFDELDALTCSLLMERGRYQPAQDERGQAVDGYAGPHFLWSSTIATPPQLRNLHQLVTSEDYPSSALRAREEGSVEVEVLVEPNGRASLCTVTQSSNSPALDERSCALFMDRAQFEPAVDHEGKAAAATYRRTLRWDLPSEGMTVKDVYVRMDVSFGRAGRIDNCSMAGSDPILPVCIYPLGHASYRQLSRDGSWDQQRRIIVREARWSASPELSPRLMMDDARLPVLAFAAARIKVDGSKGRLVSCEPLGGEAQIVRSRAICAAATETIGGREPAQIARNLEHLLMSEIVLDAGAAEPPRQE